MSRTFVAGTAGHVDHGKSSLVRTLTGTDPDRLAEEQLRHMTIDLGFAELITPAGNRLHLVDVPGHERFVRNMLAGAGGIDLAILTIAADDGPMPQTREHLAILDLLGIEHGVVALSKCDLVDGEWQAFVAESVRELLHGTYLADAEIVPVSSVTGAGLSEFRAALDRVLARIDRVQAASFPRLPIDRVFSSPGFGTVVTGTLQGATLRVGDRLEILPGERMSRVRGLQTFGEAVERTQPGSRVAVNLTGLETSELGRGDVLTWPGMLHPALRLDAHVQILSASERALQHNDEVIVFAGSSETPARAAVLDRESIEPGDAGWVQLRLFRPAVVLPRDRFILRRPSPAETIGGGVILELDAPRHKRFQPPVIARLTQLQAGDPGDVLLAWLGARFVTEAELKTQAATETIEGLLAANRLRCAGTGGERWCAATPVFDAIVRQIFDTVDRYHADHPLEPGIPREMLVRDIGSPRVALDVLLAQLDELEDLRSHIRRAEFQIVLNADQQVAVDAFLIALDHGAFQPPTPEEVGLRPELQQAMIAMGTVIPVGDGIVFRREQIEIARSALLEALAMRTSISLADYRDLLGTTRKFAQALLEFFDQQRVTRRIGDRRVAVRPHQRQESASRP